MATRDLPEFASSAMDGFAVRASDISGATPGSPVELKIVGRAMIGRRPEAVVGGGEAVRIATGAPIPAGADTVVPIENAEPGGEMVQIFDAPVAGKHVRPAGEDVKDGQVLVPAGKRLGPPELGLLANAGFPHPIVHRCPRVIVLSTGDGSSRLQRRRSSVRSATRTPTRCTRVCASSAPCRCSRAS